LLGLVLLVSNNPHKKLPQLGYRKLSGSLVFPGALSVMFGLCLGLGARALAKNLSAWTGLRYLGLDDDAGFFTVWGIHTGIYAGALFGLVLAAVRVRKRRHRLTRADNAVWVPV